MTVAFDTLKFVQTLRDKAGVSQPEAEGIAEAFANATGEQIALKVDLEQTEMALRGDMSILRSELKQTELSLRSEIKQIELSLRSELKQTELSLKVDMKDLKGEQIIIRWMMGFVLAFQVAIFVKLFFH